MILLSQPMTAALRCRGIHMAIADDPRRDPYDDEPPRRHKAPKALRHLRRTLTDEMARKAFEKVFKRPPASETELDTFVESYTLEMYNGGFDEWPELRKARHPDSAI